MLNTGKSVNRENCYYRTFEYSLPGRNCQLESIEMSEESQCETAISNRVEIFIEKILRGFG